MWSFSLDISLKVRIKFWVYLYFNYCRGSLHTAPNLAENRVVFFFPPLYTRSVSWTDCLCDYQFGISAHSSQFS